MLAWLLALVVSNTVYAWTDAQGLTHYTDDPTRVPAGARVRTTAGAHISVVPSGAAQFSGRQRAAATPVVKPAASKTACDVLREDIVVLERQVAASLTVKTVTTDSASWTPQRDVREALLACQPPALDFALNEGQLAHCVWSRLDGGDAVAAPTPAPAQRLDEARARLRDLEWKGCR